ncbi:MAG: XRE family transcriptional regulator [Pseudomonadota bacterium]
MTGSGTHETDLKDAKAAPSRAREVAARLRDLRIGSGLTLREVAAATDLSISQLSKLETGAARLTVDLALRMAGALKVPANAFFLQPNAETSSTQPVLTRADDGIRHRLKGMDFEVLCGSVAVKRALNWRVTIYGKTLEACGGLRSHAGQEFLHVLSGELTLYFALAPSIALGPGDSLVFEGPLAHGYAAKDGEAVAVMTNSVAP